MHSFILWHIFIIKTHLFVCISAQNTSITLRLAQTTHIQLAAYNSKTQQTLCLLSAYKEMTYFSFCSRPATSISDNTYNHNNIQRDVQIIFSTYPGQSTAARYFLNRLPRRSRRENHSWRRRAAWARRPTGCAWCSGRSRAKKAEPTPSRFSFCTPYLGSDLLRRSGIARRRERRQSTKRREGKRSVAVASCRTRRSGSAFCGSRAEAHRELEAEERGDARDTRADLRACCPSQNKRCARVLRVRFSSFGC